MHIPLISLVMDVSSVKLSQISGRCLRIGTFPSDYRQDLAEIDCEVYGNPENRSKTCIAHLAYHSANIFFVHMRYNL
ncbi:hypothetical protein MPTK1_8g13640 [Marchantia polymorpha subsp. ruderalis]|uniref:Uncharacterized protein n=1 Tax=Marchantia polymorpha TaxID=3197 RepID=A0A2R6WCG8_MARPO|nr:hypothetical protein MARPO_0110s0043 [Marchantia polymorpha]BBN19785.1 hypothetical protein Mp_8g13640 [Marchantia polymorpha subsp. ruderalis]|eukprot:PTQ31554.1 hypothetical protein MARPO_0110s0043 [Marchantia polymorpha]